MGRQAHITRLALGRSPFEPPLRDEFGEFILGRGAQENTAKGYIQQFNDSGHPINKQSDAAARKLRRAQNDVLELAGVVSREVPNDERQEKLETLREENQVGEMLEAIDEPLTKALLWWTTSLQHRLMTFQSYNQQSFMEVLFSDLQTMGFWPFYLTGLPSVVLAGMVARLRRSFQRRQSTLDTDDIFHADKPKWRRTISLAIQQVFKILIDVAFYGLEWHLESFAILQTLRLIPAMWAPTRSTALPWVSVSILSPRSSQYLITTTAVGHVVSQFMQSPFLVGYLRDRLRSSLQTRAYAVIRSLAVKPGIPDELSIEAWKEQDRTDATKPYESVIFPLTTSLDSLRMFRGCMIIIDDERKPLLRAIKWAFPEFTRIWNYFSGRSSSTSRTQSISSQDAAFRRTCTAQYYEFVHLYRSQPQTEETTDHALRRRAVQAAISSHGMDETYEEVDIQAIADDLSTIESHTSTTTPDPMDLALEVVPELQAWTEQLNQDEAPQPPSQPTLQTTRDHIPPAQLEISGENEDYDGSRLGTDARPSLNSNAVEGLADIPTEPFDPTVPLEALLEPLSVETQLQLPDIPESPVVGISRAVAIPQNTPRPVRRPTEVDPDIQAVAEELRSITLPKMPSSLTRNANVYRVTTLSNWPAELLATQGSIFIASVMMLPLELYYFRLLAKNFFDLPKIVGLDSQISRSDVMTTGPWLGLSSMSIGNRRSFISHLLLSFGLQGLANFLVWRLGSKLASYIGWLYDWGEY